MRPNEAGTVKELQDFELNSQALKLVPGKPEQIRRFDRDCFILETDQGDLALWVHHRSEAVLAYQNQILKICENNDLKGFLYPIPLNDGRSYAPWDERRWFYVTDWPETRKVSFRSGADISSLARLLAGFRKVLSGQGLGFVLPGRNEDADLISRFQRITECLDSFTLLAQYRLRPTQFDRMFLSYLPEARIWVQKALGMLEKYDYVRLLASLTTHNLIINRLVRGNLRFRLSGDALCLRLNDFRWDLPVIDLAILLIKTGRSVKWNSNWFHFVLAEYKELYPLNPAEEGVLRAYLSFPWSFYRLAARYYYNRTQWTLFTFMEKMERVLAEEEHRRKLILNFDEFGG